MIRPDFYQKYSGGSIKGRIGGGGALKWKHGAQPVWKPFWKSRQRMIWVGSWTVGVEERNNGFEEYQGGKVSKAGGVGRKARQKSWRTALHFLLGQLGWGWSREGARYLDLGRGRKGDAEFSFSDGESEVPKRTTLWGWQFAPWDLGLKREIRRRESGLEIERNKHNKDIGNNENSRWAHPRRAHGMRTVRLRHCLLWKEKQESQQQHLRMQNEGAMREIGECTEITRRAKDRERGHILHLKGVRKMRLERQP